MDSYSQDDTVDIALRYGVHIVQQCFGGFGDHWNFALQTLPIMAPWMVKLDPDGRLSDELKGNLLTAMRQGNDDRIWLDRRLGFMGRTLPVRQRLVRGYEKFRRCQTDWIKLGEEMLKWESSR